MSYSGTKLKSIGEKASACFRGILNRKYMRLICTYTDLVIGLPKDQIYIYINGETSI
jgi:hypothetical protein